MVESSFFWLRMFAANETLRSAVCNVGAFFLTSSDTEEEYVFTFIWWAVSWMLRVCVEAFDYEQEVGARG
jgi:hypothetical protein